MRTTEQRHRDATHEVWNKLTEREDIYFDRYSGLYCISCEAFYPEKQAEDGVCPHHGTKLEHTEEDGFFFRLSRYQDWIVEHIKANEDFVFPSSARKEILSRLESEPLRDLSISRPNQGWGITVPNNDNHVIYTWFDALINYYTVPRANQEWLKYWPAEMHVIGKDIIWFHGVIWPVMLHAAQMELPKQIYVHGMLLAADGRKMSKSLGNVVDPYRLIGKVPNDVIRYYMARAIPSGHDGAFGVQELVHRYNTELANDLGNLASRLIKLTQKHLGREFDCEGVEQVIDFSGAYEQIAAFMQTRMHHRALDLIWGLVGELNAYLNTHEPWRIKDDDQLFKKHMANCLCALSGITLLLRPFLPDTADKLGEMLSWESGECSIGPMTHWPRVSGAKVSFGEVKPLFPRLEVNAEGEIQLKAGR